VDFWYLKEGYFSSETGEAKSLLGTVLVTCISVRWHNYGINNVDNKKFISTRPNGNNLIFNTSFSDFSHF
jgi:hypothetical protein